MLKNEPSLAIVAVDTEENGQFLFSDLNPARVLICVEVPRPSSVKGVKHLWIDSHGRSQVKSLDRFLPRFSSILKTNFLAIRKLSRN